MMVAFYLCSIYLIIYLKCLRMKTRHSFTAILLAAGFALSAFLASPPMGGTIKGRITPADGAFRACAVSSSSDSTKANIVGGAFEIKELKPGIYTLVIEGTSPYKTTSKTGLQVKEAETTDVGEIILEQ
jgi:hypothetical protein